MNLKVLIGLVSLCALGAGSAAGQQAAAFGTVGSTDEDDMRRSIGMGISAAVGKVDLTITTVTGSFQRLDTPCAGLINPDEGCHGEQLVTRHRVSIARVGWIFERGEGSVQFQAVPALGGGTARIAKFRINGTEVLGDDLGVLAVSLQGRVSAPLGFGNLRWTARLGSDGVFPIQDDFVDGYRPFDSDFLFVWGGIGLSVLF